MVTTDEQGPHELMQADPFSGSALSEPYKAFRNVGFCLLQLPLSQVVIDFCRCQAQSLG